MEDIKPRGAPVALHSGGNTTSELDYLVTVGIDGLNPIPARCGTILHEIRKKYPRLALLGTVDTHHTLPFGNEDEIEEEIPNTIKGCR